MVGRNRFRRAAVLVLLQRSGQIFGRWHIAPLFNQLAVLAKNEHAKQAHARLRIKLRSNSAIEIRHGENIIPGISRNLELIVAGLESFRL